MVEAGWGRVVTIASDAGRKGETGQAIYGSAKAGAMGFMRGLAAEVGAHGVTANCVSLGTMRTGPTAEALERDPELERRLARAYTVPRIGLPADVAPLVALLCSDAGAWITGQVYPVDGGYISAALTSLVVRVAGVTVVRLWQPRAGARRPHRVSRTPASRRPESGPRPRPGPRACPGSDRTWPTSWATTRPTRWPSASPSAA